MHRFILRKLQIEMNDLLSRTTVGRLVKDIKVRDFNVGSQFPAFKQVGISNVQLSQDKESFEVRAIGSNVKIEIFCKVVCFFSFSISKWMSIIVAVLKCQLMFCLHLVALLSCQSKFDLLTVRSVGRNLHC